jgi:hypothetical protein
VPQVVVPPEQLLGRAEQLRRGVHAAGGVTAPSVRVNPPQPGANPLPAPPMTPMAPIGPEVIPTPQPAPVAPPGYLPSP